MSIENNGPEAAYPGPDEPADNSPVPDNGMEQAGSEPNQSKDERPEDWNPPPGNPGSDQDAQVNRENGSAKTDSLTDSQ